SFYPDSYAHVVRVNNGDYDVVSDLDRLPDFSSECEHRFSSRAGINRWKHVHDLRLAPNEPRLAVVSYDLVEQSDLVGPDRKGVGSRHAGVVCAVRPNPNEHLGPNLIVSDGCVREQIDVSGARQNFARFVAEPNADRQQDPKIIHRVPDEIGLSVFGIDAM